MSSNKVYDILKWISIIFLPALAKLIEGIFGVWGIPYGTEIASTIIHFQIFLGAILVVSSAKYYMEKSKQEKEKEPEILNFEPLDENDIDNNA